MASGGPPRQTGPRASQPIPNVLRQPRGPGPDAEAMNFQMSVQQQNRAHRPHQHTPPQIRYPPQPPLPMVILQRQQPPRPSHAVPIRPRPPHPSTQQYQQQHHSPHQHQYQHQQTPPQGGGFHQEMVLDTSYLEGCASLLDQIDKKVVVVLRDRRNIIGILRSCDQFNNLVLHQAVERIHVDKAYGDIPRGVFLIRGDNVVLVGEIDAGKEAASPLVRVPVERILALQRQQDEERRGKDIKRSELARLRGVTNDFDGDGD